MDLKWYGCTYYKSSKGRIFSLPSCKNCTRFTWLGVQHRRFSYSRLAAYWFVYRLVKIIFLWRILLLPMSNIYKTILIRSLLYHIENYNDKECGSIMNALNTCTKYGLQHFIVIAIESANYCTIKLWEKMMSFVIQQKHFDQTMLL